MHTTPHRKSRSSGPLHGLKAVTGEPGTFEAIVAVFGNVDLGNDRIVAGAFAKSLERWAASGDPIPVVFSHQWDDLESHVGYVVEAKELLPGDEALPPELSANGGLWTKFRLDVEDPDERAARLLAKRLTDRRIREFSFAYDVVEEKRATDGANELLELDVIEVGPTLKGMNPATVLLSRARKALGDDASDEEVIEAIVKALDGARAGDAKAWITLAGSMESAQEAAFAAAHEWAAAGNIGDGGFYSAYLEATYPDRLVILVEGWDDPVGEGVYYELDYAIGEDGTASVDNPRAVAIEATAVAKSRAMKHRIRPGSANGEKAAPTVAAGKSEGQDPPVEEPEDEDRSDETELAPADPALVELDLVEIETSTTTTGDTSDAHEDGARS